jgi:UDP-N-acetylglucosamine transferase subunit ALG13
MIFVTIGTSEPFDRLMSALDELDLDDELYVQLGRSSVRPRQATCVDFMSYDEVVERVASARAVVMHAGAGSVLVALAHGKRPVVVPRLRRYGEAVDDHQVAFGRRLARAGLVDYVDDPTDLGRALASAGGSGRFAVTTDGPLVHELRGLVVAAVHAQHVPRRR